MKIPEGLKYSKDHEWVLVEGGSCKVGITDYAQHSLGEIVFVELPENGSVIKAGGILGVVESVKAASDIYSPVSGTVTAIGEELADQPAMVNQNPYESWIATLELTDPSELNGLMDAETYEAFCKEGE